MAIVEIKVPQFSESVSEGTLLDWKKKVGEAIAQDETVIEVETDKVVLEVPAPAAGVLVEVTAAAGDTVTSEQIIAKIDTDAKAGAAAPVAAKPAEAWRYAVAGLRRRGLGSALQVVALGLGLMALLLLAVTRNDLVAGWRQSSPPDAPNRFVIDIQPGQDAPVLAQLRAAGLPNVQLSPMIRARLTAINGKPVTGDSYAEVRARRLAEREFNLSYTAVLPEGNRVTAGQWYGDASTPQVSMEEGIAKTLGLTLGDTLRFEVAGQHIDAPITSLRKLDWGSMRVNFFVVMPPAALRDFPMTWITSFHLAPKQQGVADALVRQFPNVTVIDTGALLAQIQQILSQVIDAVQALFVFTLAAGVLVLYAALAGTRDERMRESGILRALGASSRQLRDVHLAELVTVGALAGLLAALGAGALGWALARYVFEFALHFNPWLPALGVGAGVLCALIGGWSGLRAVLRQSALRTLREA